MTKQQQEINELKQRVFVLEHVVKIFLNDFGYTEKEILKTDIKCPKCKRIIKENTKCTYSYKECYFDYNDEKE